MFVSLKGLQLKRYASHRWRWSTTRWSCSPCLTTEFLVPYLNVLCSFCNKKVYYLRFRKIWFALLLSLVLMHLDEGKIIKASLNLSRRSHRQWVLKRFRRYIDPAEYIKRLATAQGIDVLNLVKTQEQLQQDMQQQMQMQEQQELTKQTAAMQKVNVDQQKADVESAQALSEIRTKPKNPPVSRSLIT